MNPLFYETPIKSPPELQQGDIFFEVPFAPITLAGSLAARGMGFQKVEVKLDWQIGIVLTHTCDLQRGSKDVIKIARVDPISKRSTDPVDTPKKIRDTLRHLSNPGRFPTLFPILPYKDDMPLCVAVLYEVQVFPLDDLDEFIVRREARLSSIALRALQERISYCSERFAVPDDLYTLSDVDIEQALLWLRSSG